MVVQMKQIQEWLGHADFSTTANIYSHLDYTTKQNSANTISNVFSFVETTKQAQEEIKQEQKTNQQQLLEEIAKLKQRIKEQEEDKEYLD